MSHPEPGTDAGARAGAGAGAVRLRVEHGSPLVRAGVAALLLPHGDRVRLLGADSAEVAQVVLFELQDTGTIRPYAARGAALVALAWDDSSETCERGRALGAAAVVSVHVGGDHLVATILAAHAGVVRMGDLVAVVGSDPLSARETDVVSLICRGLSNEEVAAQLSLSINSIKTYIRTAYRKMGVRSRAQAVLWGLRHGL